MSKQFIQPFTVSLGEYDKVICQTAYTDNSTVFQEWKRIVEANAALSCGQYVLAGELSDDANMLSITSLYSVDNMKCYSYQRISKILTRYMNANVVDLEHIQLSDGYDEKRKALVLYHKEDNDGVFSGALAAYYLMMCKGISKENIVMVGHDYNSIKSITAPLIRTAYAQMYEYVIMTDISVPVDLLHIFQTIFESNFIWFDHHAPIVNAAVNDGIHNKITGVRVTGGQSAVQLIYYYIKAQTVVPVLRGTNILDSWIKYLSLWDSWSYSPDDKDLVRNINKGTTVKFQLNIEKFLEVLYTFSVAPEYTLNNDFLPEIENIGKMLNEQEDEQYAQMVKNYGDNSFSILYNGNIRSACALFIQGPTNSLMFKTCGVECGLVFKHRPNDNWTVSIYNTDSKYDAEFHCGNFAREKYNGGGHAGAAGFELTQKEFIKILETKIL